MAETHLRYDGRNYRVDRRDADLFAEIQDFCRVDGLIEFEEKAKRADVRTMKAMLWLAQRGAGETVLPLADFKCDLALFEQPEGVELPAPGGPDTAAATDVARQAADAPGGNGQRPALPGPGTTLPSVQLGAASS